MIVGIDVGGTNTDIAVIDDGDIKTAKIPNDLGISSAIKTASKLAELKKSRLVISTSLLTNFTFGNFNRLKTLTILTPGPGLNYSHYGVQVKGAVNHRGEVVEDIDEDEVRYVLKNGDADTLAIASKFSIRNPELELKIFEIAKEYFDEHSISMSHYISILNYPLRINTAIVNSRMGRIVKEMTDKIKRYIKNFYYYKGDGGIIPYEIALKCPAELYNSSSSAVAIGAKFLTNEKNALVIDIGGTTTDFVFIKDGKLLIDDKTLISGYKTGIRCVKSFSIPYGGDSIVIKGELRPERKGNSLAFGGEFFTLTDALNCIGYEIGDYRNSRNVGRDEKLDKTAEKVVEDYINMVSQIVKELGAIKIIGTGYLAGYLIDKIAKKAGVKYVLPRYYSYANAIGVAVSRVSLTLYARFDSENGRAIFNGETIHLSKRISKFPSDEELIEITKDVLRKIAIDIGAYERDVDEINIIYFRSFNVIRNNMRVGKIADVIAQIEPDVSGEFL